MTDQVCFWCGENHESFECIKLEGSRMTAEHITFFVDDLDGPGSIGINRGKRLGTQTLNHWGGGDEWFYPSDLHYEPFVLNVFGGKDKPEINVYALPEDWEMLVKTKSIHDVMEGYSNDR